MRFSEIYSKPGHPVFSLEFFPPKKPVALPQTLDLIRRLAVDLRPDFLTVTYGAGGGTRALTREITRFVARELAIPAVAHLTCVGHTLEELDQILAGYSEDGVAHILALRGDRPEDTALALTQDAFTCARDLAKHIKKSDKFSIAVAGYPERHPDAVSWESEYDYLREKIDSGGEVIFTQLFFESDLYFRFLEGARKRGINTPIVPGIMPISNVKQVERFTKRCGASIPSSMLQKLHAMEDDRESVLKFGTEWAIEQCSTLLAGGAPGIHFYTLNRSGQVETILRSIRPSSPDLNSPHLTRP